jgi:hypothetical protein
MPRSLKRSMAKTRNSFPLGKWPNRSRVAIIWRSTASTCEQRVSTEGGGAAGRRFGSAHRRKRIFCHVSAASFCCAKNAAAAAGGKPARPACSVRARNLARESSSSRSVPSKAAHARRAESSRRWVSISTSQTWSEEGPCLTGRGAEAVGAGSGGASRLAAQAAKAPHAAARRKMRRALTGRWHAGRTQFPT